MYCFLIAQESDLTSAKLLDVTSDSQSTLVYTSIMLSTPTTSLTHVTFVTRPTDKPPRWPITRGLLTVTWPTSITWEKVRSLRTRLNACVGGGHVEGGTSLFGRLRKTFVCNPCQFSPSLTILVWFKMYVAKIAQILLLSLFKRGPF